MSTTTDHKYHTPLFTKEIKEWCIHKQYATAIDATTGEGGHTKLLLDSGLHVYSLDYDEAILEACKARLASYGKQVTFLNSNFANLAEVASKLHAPIDVVLFDYGISMWHYRYSGRGFSLDKKNEPLDMRSDTTASVTAAALVRHMSKKELQAMLETYGEVRNSATIAAQMYSASHEGHLNTVGDLLEITHEQTRQVMQALRIVVNDEFESLKKGLHAAVTIVRQGGSIITITFHSLEDRIVKLQMKKEAGFTLKKELKQRELAFAHSATLRIYEHTTNEN